MGNKSNGEKIVRFLKALAGFMSILCITVVFIYCVFTHPVYTYLISVGLIVVLLSIIVSMLLHIITGK